jgi:hypothetical protein
MRHCWVIHISATPLLYNPHFLRWSWLCIIGEAHHASLGYGWEAAAVPSHNWITLRERVQDHIKSLNFGYRVELRENGVTYLNKLGSFLFIAA